MVIWLATSSDTIWTGTLTINGKLGVTTLQFGTDSNGLTSEQLDSISMVGATAGLDEQGYLFRIENGTLIILQ